MRRQVLETSFGRNLSQFIYFEVGFKNVATQTKSAVIPSYENFCYFTLNQQLY